MFGKKKGAVNGTDSKSRHHSFDLWTSREYISAQRTDNGLDNIIKKGHCVACTPYCEPALRAVTQCHTCTHLTNVVSAL